MNIKVGYNYSGVGYSGLTDGKIVNGKLIEIFIPHDHAIIVCEKTNRHCAVIYKTLKQI